MRGLIMGLLAGAAALSSASASFTCTFFNISGDPDGTYSAYYQELRDAVSAAGDEWAQYLPESANLEIQITLVAGSEVSDSPVSLASPGKQNGFDIFQPGVEFELDGHGDPNGEAADLSFQIGTSLLPQLWFDPNPAARIDSVPGGRIDAISLFMRGFGRSLGFFSYLQTDGSLGQGQNYQSSFDLNVSSNAGNPFFNGTRAVALNGGPVALTNGPVYPLASSFNDDVMSSAGINAGQRYFVSALDLAILADSGLETLPIPEPGVPALLGASALAALASSRRRKPASVEH